MTRAEAAREMARVGKWIMEKGLTWGTAGNMSVRVDADHILVTASGTRLDALDEADFSLVSMADGTWQGGKPSKEWPMHLAAYRACPWAGAALHTSPPCGTLFSITGEPVRNDLFVENMYYMQRTARVGYYHPGSEGLAQGVARVAGQANVLLLAHHGVLVYDATLAEAATGLEILEETCRMQMNAAQAGQALPGLPPETVSDFLQKSGYKAPRVWPEAQV